MGSCLIVGAGMTGMSAARHLLKKGWDVQILEKSARPGGRMATRQIQNVVFDYGAQFITTFSLPFRALFEDWEDAHLVDEWCRGFLSGDHTLTYDGYARYRAKQGMNSIAQLMAAPLPIQYGTQVSLIKRQQQLWNVQTTEGAAFEAETILLTNPVPQARKLLAPALDLTQQVHEALEHLKYEPCIAMMAVTSGESGIPEPGAIQFPGEPLLWLCDTSQKNADATQTGLIIHTGKMFSKQYWKTEPEALVPLIWEMVRPHVECQLLEGQIHRWLYSRPLFKHPQPYLVAHEEPLLLFAGDAFGEGPETTVETAAMSGLAAAKYLQKRAEQPK